MLCIGTDVSHPLCKDWHLFQPCFSCRETWIKRLRPWKPTFLALLPINKSSLQASNCWSFTVTFHLWTQKQNIWGLKTSQTRGKWPPDYLCQSLIEDRWRMWRAAWNKLECSPSGRCSQRMPVCGTLEATRFPVGAQAGCKMPGVWELHYLLFQGVHDAFWSPFSAC